MFPSNCLSPLVNGKPAKIAKLGRFRFGPASPSCGSFPDPTSESQGKGEFSVRRIRPPRYLTAPVRPVRPDEYRLAFLLKRAVGGSVYRDPRAPRPGRRRLRGT